LFARRTLIRNLVIKAHYTPKGFESLIQMRSSIAKKKRRQSYGQRKKEIQYLMFLKEKCDISIKARGYANGRSQ